MSDDQAIEVIRLRHRLRVLVALPGAAGPREAAETLDRFRALCESLDDPELIFEHARWWAQLEQAELRLRQVSLSPEQALQHYRRTAGGRA